MKICKFGDGEAVVRVIMNKGCVCFPDDKEQYLCFQHLNESEPLGSFEVTEKLYK